MGQSLCTGDLQPKLQPREKGAFKGDVDELGRPDGKGQMNYKDGSFFIGSFDKGRPSHGKFHYPNGDTYEGYLTKCKPHGKGIWRQKNGIFQGEFEDGQFINGTISYSDGSKYTGQMRNNQKCGQNCQFIYADGDKFTGQFKANELYEGTLEKKNGISYKGSFLNGMKHGHGLYTARGVMDYEGEFQFDQFHGKGKQRIFKTNVEYSGDFVEGKKQGHGVLTESTGAVYEGQFHDNEKHGKGTLRFNQKTYTGDFKEGYFWGEGVLSHGNGDVYTGSFVKDKKEGHGKMHIERLKEEYEGQFMNDKVHGMGKIVYGNGDIFEGLMQANKKHGRGKYISKLKGDILEGEWVSDVKSGQFVQTKPYDKVRMVGSYHNGERHGKFKYTSLETNQFVREEDWEEGRLIYK